MKKALFLDLDWTLIRPKSGAGETTCLADENIEGWLPKGKTAISTTDIGNGQVRVKYVNTFPENTRDWEFVPGMIKAIQPYLENGYLLIIISNQGGISAGYQTEGEIQEKLNWILANVEVEVSGLTFSPTPYETASYFCPTNDPYDRLRKPNPGMIELAVKDHDLFLPDCLFVGDMNSDKECAEAARVPYQHVSDFLSATLYTDLADLWARWHEAEQDCVSPEEYAPIRRCADQVRDVLTRYAPPITT